MHKEHKTSTCRQTKSLKFFVAARNKKLPRLKFRNIAKELPWAYKYQKTSNRQIIRLRITRWKVPRMKRSRKLHLHAPVRSVKCTKWVRRPTNRIYTCKLKGVRQNCPRAAPAVISHASKSWKYRRSPTNGHSVNQKVNLELPSKNILPQIVLEKEKTPFAEQQQGCDRDPPKVITGNENVPYDEWKGDNRTPPQIIPDDEDVLSEVQNSDERALPQYQTALVIYVFLRRQKISFHWARATT